MRPLRSFLILLIFLACFTGLHYVGPADQLFPPAEEFIPGALLDLIPTASVDTTLIRVNQKPVFFQSDSLRQLSKSVKDSPIRGFLDSLENSPGQIRVLYYGDSQIEGDRFTSYLRQNLRKWNPGTGPGLFLPLMPVMFTKSVTLSSSSNWRKYNFLSYKNKEISHNRFGPFMSVCRYLPEGTVSDDPVNANVSVIPSAYADSATAEFDLLRLFYNSREGIVRFTVKADGEYIFSDTLSLRDEVNEISCRLNGARNILLEFSGSVSPDIYGISIESETGVIVDNIPQRGSAGLEFTMVDSTNLAKSFRMLDPDLFILQYGLNVVRNVRDDYSYYQSGLERQLSLLKWISPSVPVLVISVTDMASNEEGSIRSFQNIPSIIEAQRMATEKAGAAFWNSYDAMGGDSSILRWSEKKIPLAQKDYVHFTYSGADTLSKILAEAVFTRGDADSAIVSGIRSDSLPEIDNINVTTTLNTEDKDLRSIPKRVLSLLISYDPDKPMIFTTAVFWIFVLFVLAGYSIIYRKKFLRNFYLLIVSLFFYYKAGGLLLFLLMFVIVIDFVSGLLIHNSRTKFMRRVYILLSIISNLGILAYFKYTVFFLEAVNSVLGTDLQVHDYLASFSNSLLGTTFDISNIILPVGISFFTFQSLSYTFDVYRGRMLPVKNIIDFGFFVSFFPQLVAGPIVRASEFIPQLYNEFHLSKREFSHALFLISKGLIKKIIISDFIAVNFVDRIFDAPAMYSGFENLMAVYGYGLQIYCDFSGYTDIAIGLGLIFGFRFPVNFNSPYKAAGVTEFWKRWHISLSRWLKDYLYISLGGNRKGNLRTYLNLMLTMLLGGLWHGASLRFVIWGGMHGLGLVINRMWISVTGGRILKGRAGRAIGVLITFNFVSFCWIFFRAPDMDSVAIMLSQIANSFSPGSYQAVIPAYSSVFLLMAAGYAIHFLPEKVKESYRGLFINIPVVMQLAAVMLVAVLLYQMRSTDVMPFIYFRF